MKLIYLKPALKCDSFDVAIGIKIPVFRVLVTIEPGRSLLQFVTTKMWNFVFLQEERSRLPVYLLFFCVFFLLVFPRDNRNNPMVLEYQKRAHKNGN